LVILLILEYGAEGYEERRLFFFVLLL